MVSKWVDRGNGNTGTDMFKIVIGNVSLQVGYRKGIRIGIRKGLLKLIMIEIGI